MISKTESGRVGYGKKYRVAGRVRVPTGHCISAIYQFIRFKSVGETDHTSAYKEAGDRCSWAASPGVKSCQGRGCKKVDGAA